MSQEISFKDRVVIVTGAGGGLGRVYALAYAQRGASVVVNDLGAARSGEGHSSRAADTVVEEIKKLGGKAVANYNSVEDGDQIVKTALDAFGRIDIVVNNAGIINTASAAGIYGNYGQANYSAAKLALHGLTMTLAREGEKSNIRVNTVAPLAASRMTESVLPPEILQNLKPEFVAPLVMYLTGDEAQESGSLFEVGAGYLGKLRWERSKGAIFKTDDTFTPASVQAKWKQVCDFTDAEHPQTIMDVDWMGILDHAKNMPPTKKGDELRFDGRVVLVTGAGGGIGRCYALMFAALGASVVVNDLGTSTTGEGASRAADVVVGEIKSQGGKAVANYDSVEDGDKLVKTAIEAFGRIDVIVNNAGILRDKSFSRMTDGDWDLVQRVHLRGTYKVTHAAWPHFLKQKYGRIINTASAVGLYGNFGQANYSSAKIGIIGFGNTLAIEGAKHNILINTIAPNAGTRMTATVMPPEMVNALRPEYVAPLIGYLGHESNSTSAGVFEVGSGWIAKVRWQRSKGIGFPVSQALVPEHIREKWEQAIDFSQGASYPTTTQESFQAVFENMTAGGASKSTKKPSAGVVTDPKIEAAKKVKYPTSKYEYTDKEVILYNLGVGATRKNLNLVYENNENFTALPTFGVIPPFQTMMTFPMADVVGNFNPMMLLHGEQYMELKKPFPATGATLTNEISVLDVADKGKGCVLILAVKTKDALGDLVCYNEYSNFIRGVSGVGTKGAVDRGAATASNEPPKRKPDVIVTEKTSADQAALYRLSGDRNPLHIDPEMSKMGGFDVPILHGLCSFGIAGKHVFQNFCKGDASAFKSIKVRFAKFVFPGETLQTEMWKSDDGKKIIFQVRVLERDVLAITNAAVELNVAGSASEKSLSSSPAAASSAGLPAVDGFKSSALFQQIAAGMKAGTEASRKQNVKKINSIFLFEITSDNKSKKQQWYIDLKNGTGSVGLGKPAASDVQISIADSDFVLLASGKLSGQKAFSAGKIKVKGQMMLATKLDAVLKDSIARAKM